MGRRVSGFLQVALGVLTASLVLQVGSLAQRAGGASMSSAHSSGTGHVTPSFAGGPRSFAPPQGSLFQSPHLRSGLTAQTSRWPSTSQARRPYRWNRVGYRGPYLYAGYPGLIPFGYGVPYPYAFDYGDDEDDSVAQPAPPQADYGNQPIGDYGQEAPGPQLAANAPTPFRPAYQGEGEIAPVHAQPATTLIFKDGRSPVYVHNYALTASTLYALDDDSRQEISLSLLDVPATMEVNRKAGVDFALPVSH